MKGTKKPNLNLTEGLKKKYSRWTMVGRGGMGTVYKAYNRESGEWVAVKFLHAGDELNDSYLRKFEREFLAISKLSHPNIVKVLEFGQSLDRPFFSMEYLVGTTLRNHPDFAVNPADSKLLGDPQRLQRLGFLLLDVLNALSYIHYNRIVHRDLKPENIFILDDGVVKIFDFGLIRSIDLTVFQSTTSGDVVGTPAYMSPEQIVNRKIDQRADLYTFGIILYEGLTGRRPFYGEHFLELVQKQMEEIPKSPSYFNQNLDPGFETLVLDLLQKEPERRPQSAHEVMQRLTKSLPDLNYPALSVLESVVEQPPQLYIPRMVGRELELTECSRLLKEFKEKATPVGIVIEGVTGIGKTRIVDELRAQPQLLPLCFLKSSCYEDIRSPLHGFREIFHSFKSLIQTRMEQATTADSRAWDKIAPYLDDESTLKITGKTMEADDPYFVAIEEKRMIDISCDLIFNSAETRAIVLVIDDLQWADRYTLKLILALITRLNYLTHNNLPTKVTLILSWTTDAFLSVEPSILSGLETIKTQSGMHPIKLHALTYADTSLMVQSMLGSWNLDADIIQYVFQESMGNPLYIQEQVRSLVETGALKKDQLGWRLILDQISNLGTAPTQLRASEQVRRSILRRFARFPEPVQYALKHAVCLGTRFPLEYYQAVMDPKSESLSLLDQLAELNILMETQALNTHWIRFNHRIFQEVIYNNLMTDERTALHQRIAERLEALKQTGAVVRLDDLAFQFLRAGNKDKAVTYGLGAASINFRNLSYEQVARDASALYQAIEAEAAVKYKERLLLLLVRASNLLGDLETAQNYCQKLYEQAKTPLCKAKTLKGFGNIQARKGYAEAALDYYRRALAALHKLNAGRLRAEILWQMAECYRHQNVLDKCLETCHEGLKVVPLKGSKRIRLSLITELALAYSAKGQLQEAEKLLAEALSQAQKPELRNLKMQILSALTALYWQKGQIREAIANCETLYTMAKELDFTDVMVQNLGHLAFFAIQSGELDTAKLRLEEALEICLKTNDRYRCAKFKGDLGIIHVSKGDYDKAATCFQESLQAAEELKRYRLVACNLDNLAILAMHAGNHSEAAELLGRSLTLKQNHKILDGCVETLCFRIDNWLLCNDLSSAEADLAHIKNLLPQESQATLVAMVTLREAEILLRKNNYLESLTLLNNLEPKLRQLDAQLLLVDCYRLKALTYKGLKELANARTAIEKSIAILSKHQAVYELRQCYKIAAELY